MVRVCVSVSTKNNSYVAYYPSLASHCTAVDQNESPAMATSVGGLVANDTLCVYLVQT